MDTDERALTKKHFWLWRIYTIAHRLHSEWDVQMKSQKVKSISWFNKWEQHVQFSGAPKRTPGALLHCLQIPGENIFFAYFIFFNTKCYCLKHKNIINPDKNDLFLANILYKA